jgi:hypothetical protein
MADEAVALEAWRSLMSEIDFVDIARSTQRLAPMVYLNLKGVGDLPERGRLRGAYKFAWSKNHKIIASLAPVVVELNSEKINYRIAKGIAIQLILGIFGARVVGDVDLVASQEDIPVVRKILEANGFRCNSLSSCGLHPAGAIQGALDFNKGDVHLDLHVAELKQPAALMKKMLREPAHKVEYAGTVFLVPSPELLMLHSAVHGKASVSETDFSQSVADIGLLARLCDIGVLLRSASQAGVFDDLRSLGETLYDLGLRDLVLAFRGVRSPTKSAPLISQKSSGFFLKVRSALFLWRQRLHGGKPIFAVIRSFSGRKLAYLLWNLFGQFSSLERFVFARRSGFLFTPKYPLEKEGAFFPFEDSPNDAVVVNRVATECFDFRFAFRAPIGVAEFIITFEGLCLNDVDVAVHHNGERLLRIVAGANERRLAVLKPPVHNEISIRPISGSCAACFSTMHTVGCRVSYRLATP